MIGLVLDQFAGVGLCDLIVVDGQSTDRTAAVAARHGAKLISLSAGRGRQMNAGAAAAAGEHLLFLHADTILPDGFVETIGRILARPSVAGGAFRLHIDAPGTLLRWIERLVHWRSRWWRLPYGDQGLFMTARTFHRLGGFADYPAMEDVEMIRRLRRIGRIELAPTAVLTSGRRWRQRGVWRTTMLNQLCIVAYRLGVAPQRIAVWRDGDCLNSDAVDAIRSP